MTTKAVSQKRGTRKKRTAAKTQTTTRATTRGATRATTRSTAKGSSEGSKARSTKSPAKAASGAKSAGNSALANLRSPLSRGAKIRTPMEAEISARAMLLFKRGLREALAILVAVVAILMFISLVTFHVSDPGWSHTGGYGQLRNAGGIFGAWFADITMFLFGYMAYVLPFGVGLIGWNAFRERNAVTVPILIFSRTAGLILLLITACGLSDLHVFVHRGDLPIGTAGGGVLGTWVAGTMVGVVNSLGATLILLALLLGSVTFVTGVSWFSIMEQVGEYTLRAARWLKVTTGNTVIRIQDYFAWREARRLRVQMGQAEASDADEFFDDAESHQPVIISNRGIADDAADSGKPIIVPPKTHKKAEKIEPVFPEDVDSLPEEPGGSFTDKVTSAVAAGVAGVKAAADSKISIQPRPVTPAPVTPTVDSTEKQLQLFNDKPAEVKRKPGEMPPVNLLDAIESVRCGYSEESLEELSRLLESKLADFNVTVKVVEVHPGPVVTRFEVQLAPGIKVSKLTNLSKDIARSLSVLSVRVVEVIAGKSTVGLEIPNEDREVVQLTEILQSEKYRDLKSPLALALGKDISGLPVVADIAKMPHLLVAGTTGSGKSVAVNSMLISLLYKATPEQVRLILIDPKMLELNVYEGIPHLLAPVVTDMKEAANALRWCVGEMERRYRLMASLGVRNLSGFNKKVLDARAAGKPILDPLYKPEEAFDPSLGAPELDTMPFIVVVVDEFADMMMVVGKKVEELIARIAQKARAAGIHLILATQRPSVDVITGLIKANIPTRMGFQVSSRIDSRTILDQGGAEALLGHGDMLYLPPGTAQPERVHGAFVDDHEVHSVVEWLKVSGTAVYVDEILTETTLTLPGMASDDDGGDKDELYDQAVAIVTETRKASISYVQRRLKIGYNRAARIVEEMEASGVVSAVQHNGTREVIAPPPV